MVDRENFTTKDLASCANKRAKYYFSISNNKIVLFADYCQKL